MSLDLYQMKAFSVLSQTLSYTKAAQRLHVSQSAVSHAVKKLENGLGVRLTARLGRQVVLSEEGKELAASGQVVFGEMERVEASLAFRRRRIQSIKLGATVEFGTSVLVRNLMPFLVRQRDLHIDLNFANDLLPLLLSDKLDIIIDCKKHTYPGLERIDLFREQYVVVAAPVFLKGKAINAPKHLGGQTIISLDRAASWWNRFLRAIPRGERPTFKTDSIVEIDHVRGIINAAIEAVGVALLPKYSIVRELRCRALVNLFPDINIKEDQFSIYQKKKKASLDGHRRLVGFLNGIHPEEFG
jgi:LysR family transcriptional regulator, low CO2-responsive transcriptional regulator